ncbi:MAG: hypothetical protein ACQEXJ_13000 [Myxococcota bacterium]
MNDTTLHRLILSVAAAGLLVAGCSDSSNGPSGTTGDGGLVSDTADEPDVTAPDDAAVDGDDADGQAADGAACEDCGAPAVCIQGACVLPEPDGCTPGETDACYGDRELMTCDPTGTAFVPTECPGGHGCVDDECVPVVCQPDSIICEGLAATKACNEDGTAFLEPEACPEGQYCTSGTCTGTCLSDPKFGDYVGCSYWTVDLPNWPDPTIDPTPEDLPHALVISNPNAMEAEITFEPPPGVTIDVEDPTVPAGLSRVFMMPVINTEGSELSPKGIRFSSTRPILAHQFNPWKAVWSNDASLLLPESFLGKEYVVLSWPTDPRGLIEFPGAPSMESVNSFFTVAAPHDDTEVTVQVAARVAENGDVPAMEAGDTHTFTLDKGDILNIEGDPLGLTETCDLTGSTVDATRPVVVFAGHESAGIRSGYLDHLEEQMLPPHVLDTHYLAVKSKPRGNDPDIWRIQAAEDNVTITTKPPLGGANGVTLADRGDWLEVSSSQSFEIEATGKIQVGQYLVGSEDTTTSTGDPSLMLAVPTQRYRDFYVLTIPPGYDTNWVTVIRPAGATIQTPEGAIPDSSFQPLGDGDWEFAYLELEVGVRKLNSDEKFGLVVYGYNGAMSYGFTGGMD